MYQTLTILNLLATLGVITLLVRREIKSKKPLRQNFEEAAKMAASILQESIEWLDVEKQSRLPKPIHHDPIQGPRLAKLTRETGYWVPKDNPTAEPFLAAWYEKDTTYLESGTVFSPEVTDLMTDAEMRRHVATASGLGSEDSTTIPADTYVDLIGRRIPGAKFRTLYEPSNAIMEVAKFTSRTPLRNAPFVTAKAALPKLSPEEEQKLAEEYELLPQRAAVGDRREKIPEHQKGVR